MLLPSTCLTEFTQRVPVCPATATLLTALERVRQGDCDRLVLLDQHQRPVGLVRLSKLLPFLIPQRLQPQSSSATDQQPLLAYAHPQSGSPFAEESDGLLLAMEPSLIEPLTLLPETCRLRDFLPYLHADDQSHYALLNQHGAFVGLLDTSRLLKVVTMQLLDPAAAFGSDDQSCREPCPEVGQQAPCPQVPLNQSHQSILNPLLELLERLPLPLMLQTSSGQVLSQNAIWRKQVGELLDPNWVRQEAALLLETPSDSTSAVRSAPTQPFSCPDARSPQAAPLSTAAEVQATMNAVSSMASTIALQSLSAGSSLCQPGAEPNTCVCACPLKNGQEQVLQFIKIPIGNLMAPPDGVIAAPVSEVGPSPVPHWLTASKRDGASAFRLAGLLSTIDETAPSEGSIAVHGCPAAADASSLQLSSTEMLWLILAQDVTEQRQLARELTAKNADLIQLNRLKDEFLACISHELRTPLTAVLGLSSLLKDQTLGELNQRQVHYAQLIYRSGRHLMTVVNDILDLTRMETGQLELVLEPVEIATVCDRAFEQAKQLRVLDNTQEGVADDAAAQVPPFSLEIEPGLKQLVADELRLRQMLVHLLSNALKFTEAPQQLGLKVGRWGGWIAFTVWDTGMGIPADKQHLIFQKFQQLESPLTRRFEGTGLGLVLTQRLARLHGGDVTFISKAGQGSQFTILLPPSPPRNQQPPQNRVAGDAAIENPSGRVPLYASNSAERCQGVGESARGRSSVAVSNSSRLVLIVEAVPQYIETLSDQLSGLGYRVVIARSGTEALEKARRIQPCILFLNPVLPLLSGWDVLTLLKSNPDTRQIPVVMTTTKVDEEQAYRSHANDVISLPTQSPQLKRSLRRLVLEASEPDLRTQSSTPLTVLRLSPGLYASHDRPLPTLDLNQLLHSHHYRVIEADDLEQADLLARVWKPNVVLLDGIPHDRATYFQQFSQHTFLASLPLVTLDQETTQVANQVLGLLVFPCLTLLETTRSIDDDTETSALMQVIQIAAGYVWRPSIVAVDVAMLLLGSEGTQLTGAPTAGLDSFPQETEWLQALTQYLQTAGFRSLVSRSRQELQQQIQSHSIDLLLLCWTESNPQPPSMQLIADLQQLDTRPPIVVLDHRQHHTSNARSHQKLPAALRQIATQILSPSLPMAKLLTQLRQVIERSASSGSL